MSIRTTMTMTIDVPTQPAQRSGPASSPIVRLAAVEARRMLCHPVFVVAAVLTALIPVTGWGGAEAWAGQRWWLVAVAPWGTLWTGTLVAAALVAGRQQWFGTTELFPGVPLSPSERVVACVLALAGPVLATGLGVAVLAVVSARDGGFPVGAVPRDATAGIGIGHASGASLASELGLLLAAAVSAFLLDDRAGRVVPAAPVGARLRLGIRAALAVPAVVAGWLAVLVVSGHGMGGTGQGLQVVVVAVGLAAAAVAVGAAAAWLVRSDLSPGAVGAGTVVALAGAASSAGTLVPASWALPSAGWPLAGVCVAVACALAVRATTEPAP